MTRKIDIEAMMDLVIEALDAKKDYLHRVRKNQRKHGYAVAIDFENPKNSEERNIVWAYHADDRAEDKVYALIYAIDLENEERERMYSAARALRRWYNQTHWEKCPSWSLLERIGAYIFAG